MDTLLRTIAGEAAEYEKQHRYDEVTCLDLLTTQLRALSSTEDHAMPNAKDANPLTDGLMMGVVGPPGTGKSTLILSAIKYLLAQQQKSFVLLSPGRELVTYSGTDVEYEIIEDDQWEPSNKQFVATAFDKCLKALREVVRRPEIKLVGLDTASRQLQFAMNASLATYQTDNFAELENNKKFGHWSTLKQKSLEYCDVLEALRRSGKHVIAAFHADVKEVEGKGAAVTVVEGGVKKLHWEQGLVPDVMGSAREVIAGRFDLFFYHERVIVNDRVTYNLRVAPNDRAYAKSAVAAFPAAVIPSDFGEVVKHINAFLAKEKK